MTWPPPLSPAQEAHLLTLATDYALSHGLVYRPPAPSPSERPATTSVIHAPFSLCPSPFPAALYAEALALQALYNELYARVALDEAFLDEVVGGEVARVDEFQGRLYDAWKEVRRIGVKQPLHLGLFRSDYLLHAPTGAADEAVALKQVEFNTISSSFGALASKVTDLHRYLEVSGAYPAWPELTLEAMPVNGALVGLAAGLAAGHRAYGNPSAKILMVVQDDERNAFDQLALAYELQTTHHLTLLRLPFSTLSPCLSLDADTSALVLTHASLPEATEISVVYYRAGYTPTDYPTPARWALRTLIEASRAIKCPTLALQLAGAKKVQQVLCEPGRVEAFVGHGTEAAARLRASWTRLWPMDESPLGEEAVGRAYATPERFVLKPQREGGGNNVYRTDIPPYLDALKVKDAEKGPGEPLERSAYILMDLIVPPPAASLLVRAGTGTAHRAETVSELGVYGVALFEQTETEDEAGGGRRRGVGMRQNETVGTLLRTKGRESDEGGVAVGFSVIDSVLLV